MPGGCCWTNLCGGMSSRCDVSKDSVRSDQRKKSVMMDEREVWISIGPLGVACDALRIGRGGDG